MIRFRSLILALLIPLLSSCWLPNQFEAVIQIMKDGKFAVQYKGTMDYAPLVYDIKTKGLAIEEQSKKMAILERDLRRDSGFQEVAPMANGRFRVRYRHDDQITDTFIYTFVRRNAAIMKVLVGKDGRASIWFDTLGAEDAKRAASLGMSINGTVKVISDLPILESNAQQTAQQGTAKIYTWQVTRYDQTPAPKLIFKMH
ncbi:MAG: hypothetical protein HZA67_01730 [Rhodospirillales bacterium]|jgi:hypothetical protein|nr:hypothetical protein [Rhodospirillales bacterium]